MIQTGIISKVKIQDILLNQLPDFIRDESPRTVDFLKQYYISQEYQGGPTDISDNLDQYLKFDNLTPEVIVDSATTSGITTVGAEIVTVTSTKGFPNQYGLIKIDDEIITYTGITTNTFTGCIRGFSGITSYHSDSNKEDLVFNTSSAVEHDDSSLVQNLSSLFLKEFYKKFKRTFLPGLEETDFQSKLDVGTFIGEARSLYQSKGTEESFKILFKVLYGIDPKVINLEERLIKPSFANYVRRRVCVAELLSGNPIKLQGQTLLKGLTGQTLFRSDLDETINASISEIEPFERVGSGLVGFTTYYKISLFVGYDESGDVLGDFIVVPNTKSIDKVQKDATVITVDSTVGFGTTGVIISGINTITYTDKTVNQFLGCTGITDPIEPISNIRSDVTYFGFEDGDENKKVVLRLTGVLSDFEQTEKVDVEEGEIISVKGIGAKIENPPNSVNKTYEQIFCNSWIYNTSSSYFVSSFNGGVFTLSSKIDRSSLKVGDSVEIVDRDTNKVIIPQGVESHPVISNITPDFNLSLDNNNNFVFDGNINYKIRKKINKANSSAAPIVFGNDTLISDIQNVYVTDDHAFVASNSLPSFLGSGIGAPGQDGEFANFSKQIDVNVEQFTFNLSNVIKNEDGTEEAQAPDGAVLRDGVTDGQEFNIIEFVNTIPFKTGDQVFYSAKDGDTLVGLSTGSYYIEKLNDNQIKLYGSPSSVDDGSNLKFSRSSNDGIHNIVLFSQKSLQIGSQKLIKKFPLKEKLFSGSNQQTPIGEIGMLINGVEISNYKTNDKVFFGPLQSVDVLNGGQNFDVLNLPQINISTGVGSTALVQPVVTGKIVDVFVDAQDFDIDKVISIGVTGGNGKGCVLEPVISERFREQFFDARPAQNGSGGGLSTSLSATDIGKISFKKEHNFTEGEPIIYDSGFNQPIKIGDGTKTLVDNASYFPEIINNSTIRLYESIDDLNAGISTVSFNNTGDTAIGDHLFKVNKKNTLINVNVIEGGEGYSNRKLIIKSSGSGISTLTNKINFDNHGFETGDLIEYSTEIGDGISQTGDLQSIQGLSTATSYYILKSDNNSFRLADAGIGGTITSNLERNNFVLLSSKGAGYQIFKYPNIEIFSEFSVVGVGTTTVVNLGITPKVRGTIEQTYLYEKGTGYGSTITNNHKKPLISIKNGKNAVLKPIIINGKIIDVNIENRGQDYFSSPDIEITDPTGFGVGAKLRPIIGFNTAVRSNVITDVIIINAGIGYSTSSFINVVSAGQNAFFDSKVRSLTINNHDTTESKQYQKLRESDNKLKYTVTGYSTSLFGDYAGNTTRVSSIIGWAYDGNPIYGPFGSENPENPPTDTGTIKRLQSSYVKSDPSIIVDRPPVDSKVEFIEDYIFDNSGDLDEHNGRFEKTKEFPNGTYAYHTTLDDKDLPTFPYFIGKSYRSELIQENFDSNDQTNFDFNTSGLLRNTFPYKISDEFANNDFIVETNEIQNQKIQIESLTVGSVTGFEIIEKGQNYKVDEPLNFDDKFKLSLDDGGGLISLISEVNGKKITSLNTVVEEIDDSVISWSDQIINVSTPDTHGLKNNDFIKISGLSTDLSLLNGVFKIGVTTLTTKTISTITGSPLAGFTTEIFVADIPKSISIGSSIGIGTETLKILNIYRDINTLTIQRDSDNSFGTTHPKGSDVSFLPNKFTISKNIPFFESKKNINLFFNPFETIGVGTDVGEDNTITVSFAGNDISRNLPVKQIEIQNHPFKTNQKIKFSTPTGNANENILVSIDDGASTFNLPEFVFVVKKDPNHIGIKTGIGTITPEPEVAFTNLPSLSNVSEPNRDKFKFETTFNELTSKVQKIKSTITTELAHDLQTDDQINLVVQPSLSVGIGTSTFVRVVRDDITGNVLINPIGFTSLAVNTNANSINLLNHGLITGDKIKYTSNLLPDGLENKNYFVYKVDDDNIKLCETNIDISKTIPNVVGIASTGGNAQSITLINPNIISIRNNNLSFDLSDSSLSGYELGLYYDDQFKNDFKSDGRTSSFNVTSTGINGTVGAALTIGYGTSIPNILFYNLEKSGTISTTDTEVANYSKISYFDSIYSDKYNITRTGSTTFDIFVKDIPEKLSYNSSETNSLSYTTNSKNTSGSISNIKILSGGSNFKKLPIFVGVGGSSLGTGAVIIPKSDTIGNIEKVRVINEGFEYSSDKTLEPESLIASNVTIVNTNSLGIVSVTNGGSNYVTAPDIIVVDDSLGKEIQSGFLQPIMLENSILTVETIESPKRLPSDSVVLRTINNTNGISIINVASNAGSSYTCTLATPTTGFPIDPFAEGDRVFIEGIEKVSEEGTGFNSKDYGFKLLKVTKYDGDVNDLAEVTIDLSEFNTPDSTVNTGIAETVTTTFANIINESDYPKFFITLNQSKFTKGENVDVLRNGIQVDGNFEIIREDVGKLKIFNAGDLLTGDILTGQNSGSECEVLKIIENTGRLKTDFSLLKDLGWNDNIGKLNEDFQVMADNDYYQNMSYSIQSPIEWENLRTPVNNLLHISGMKNFADTGITSSTSATVGVTSGLTVIVDCFAEKRVDEIKNIDLVRDFFNEDTIRGENDPSRFILFKDIRLTDFIECKTNDVLIMDDLSETFTNIQGEPVQFRNILDLPNTLETELFNNLLIVTKSNSPNFNKIEISELLVLSNGNKNLIIQKSNLINSDATLQNLPTNNFATFTLNDDPITEITKLRFAPLLDPIQGNDVDYDLKIASSEFISKSVGVGTSSIGPINLSSRNQTCPAGITTNIISVPVDKFESLYATIYVIDDDFESNLNETFVTHTTTDTFLSEKYFNSDEEGFSLNQLGIVTSSISNGNLNLSYQNNGTNNLKIKTKIVGIGTTGVSDGTYRFKTTGQEDGSERTTIYSGVSTTNVGISTLIELNSLLFNAAKSVVEVSIGASKAIHEVLFLHDGVDAYSQQSGSLSVTKDRISEYDPSSGLGTFGASLSGNKFKLEFFPDDMVGITTVVSLNHCFYTKMDIENVPESLNYGVISETNSVVLYNSISGERIERTQFTPKVNGIPIFGKTFNPNSSQLDLGTGKFNIQNHFFRNGEELIYTPKSSFVGVGSTALQYKLSGVGIHTLPSKVFVKNSNKDSFFISTVRTGAAVTFMSVGEGNIHEFSMSKSNEKALIIIDDVAQYPLIRSNVTHTLDSNLSSVVGLTTDIIHLSGISTISTNDILKVDNEFMEVVEVGFGTTGGGPVGSSGTFKSVRVNRSFVGTSASTHSDGSTVTKFKGSYNIVGKDLFFTKPPRGDISQSKDINNLDIPTSKFSGRVYLRNNYDSNNIYDDISDQFTGVTSSFTLKVGGADTIGIGTTGGTGILFINGIFQSPSTNLNPNKNFKIIESGTGATGVTTVIFTGITSSDGSVFTSNNINTNELPRGGVPIAIGNTINGLGYAPLVGAIVKPIFNVAGEITNIVGTSFSGSNLIVENAVYDSDSGIMSIRTKNEHRFKNSDDFVLVDNIGFSPALTLKKSEFEVVSVAATNIFSIRVGKTNTEFNYTGSGTTAGDVYPYFPNLTFGSGYNNIVSIGVTVQDLGYEHRFISAITNALTIVGGGGNLTPTDASYNPETGVLIFTSPNHGLTNSNSITIDDASIFFSCSRDDFATAHGYPRSTDPASGQNLAVTKIDNDKFSVNVEVNVGSGAKITASVGVGGTLAFNIVDAGTNYQDPQIFVSEPSYSNLSVTGISRRGIGATTDTGTDLRVTPIVKPVTGIGSTLFEVSEYEIVNKGFSFKEGDVVEAVGLVTERGLNNNLIEKSTLTIEKIFNDQFALWQFGDFDYIDSIKSLQDGERSNFSLFVNRQLVSVEIGSSLNESVNVENIFLVVVNGVVQEPQKNYTIVGSNIISFAEPLLEEDDVTILFYKGTAGEDSIVNLAQTLSVEEGDDVQIVGIDTVQGQDKRTVFSLNSSQKLETNIYLGQGISDEVFRPLNLIKQKEDKVINKTLVSKKRRSIEPRITPVAKIISDLSTTDTSLFVDSTNIFNYEGDGSPSLEFTISKKNQINFETAKASAIVSASGSVTGFNTSNFGFGYATPPIVKISAPPVTVQSGLGTINNENPLVGVGSTATATATIGVGGTILSIVPNNAGLGYSQTNPPEVIISSPFTYSNTFESLRTADGASLGIQTNSGKISGIGTTMSSNKLGIKFEIIPDNITLLDFPVNDPIGDGNPIYIYDTRCGSGVTSINKSGLDTNIVGIGTSFADNIYVVTGNIHKATTGDGTIVGIITCLIHSETSHAGLSSTGDKSNPVGKYSLGKISNFTRASNPISIGVTGNTVGSSTELGISTFPTIRRTGGDITFDQTGSIQPE